MARFSDRLRAPSKRKKDAILFEISTPSGSFGGWGINLWASADFTRSQVFAERSLAPAVRSGWRYRSNRHFWARIDTAAPPASSTRPGTGPSPYRASPKNSSEPYFYFTARVKGVHLRRDPSLRFVTRDDHPWRDARFTARVKGPISGEIPRSGSSLGTTILGGMLVLPHE